MTEIVLYRNTPCDNVKTLLLHDSLLEQMKFWDNAITDKLRMQAVYNKIGDPFIISKPYDEIVTYTYGRVRFNNLWIYFSINNVYVNSQNKTVIEYRIDPWETGRWQMDLEVKRGTIKRCNRLKLNPVPNYYPVNPLYKTRRLLRANYINKYTGSIPNYYILLYKRDTSINKGDYYVIDINKSVPPELDLKWCVVGGYILDVISDDKLNFNDGSVLSAFLIPCDFDITDTDVWENLASANPSNPYRKYIYKCKREKTTVAFGKSYSITIFNDPKFTDEDDFTNNGLRILCLTDMRGNDVFTAQTGKSYNSSKNPNYFSFTMTYQVNPSVTSCNLRCKVDCKDEVNPVVGHEVDYTNYFTIPCEPLDIFTDSFTQYFTTQRQTDIDLRKVQNQQQLVNSVASVGTNAVNGAIMGSIAPGVGTLIGAAVGAATGLVSAGVNYASNEKYGNKTQEIIDKNYIVKQDSLNLSSNGVALILQGVLGCNIYVEECDKYSEKLIKEDVRINGYPCNYQTDNAEQFIDEGGFAGDFTIKGNMPELWKMDIREKLLNGVYFKKVF